MLTKALFDSPKARPLRGPFRLLLHGFQSHYFHPQPLDLFGGFAHGGPGVQVNRNAGGLKGIIWLDGSVLTSKP
jgi:hypothetical protein